MEFNLNEQLLWTIQEYLGLNALSIFQIKKKEILQESHERLYCSYCCFCGEKDVFYISVSDKTYIALSRHVVFKNEITSEETSFIFTQFLSDVC